MRSTTFSDTPQLKFLIKNGKKRKKSFKKTQKKKLIIIFRTEQP